MRVSYYLAKDSSSLVLSPKKGSKGIVSKTKNKFHDTHLDSVRFRFADLNKSRKISNHASPKKISFLKRIFYSYFSQRKVVWIRTSKNEIAVNRKEFARHLGVSNWVLTKHLQKDNVVNPQLINSSLSHAYSSATNLDRDLKNFVKMAIDLKVLLGTGGFGHKPTIKAGRAYEQSLEDLIQKLQNSKQNKDPYNKKLLKVLMKMRKFNPAGIAFDPDIQPTHLWKVQLNGLRADLQNGSVWWELNVKA